MRPSLIRRQYFVDAVEETTVVLFIFGLNRSLVAQTGKEALGNWHDSCDTCSSCNLRRVVLGWRAFKGPTYWEFATAFTFGRQLVCPPYARTRS